ncbi:MAG: hypothetical protein QME52_01120 [Bacteroidota bacterium]|nr:hypothetical protein [Bacteroidota bacterium]
MIDAVRDALDKKVPEIRDYAESEGKKLGECIITIEKMYIEGKISQEQAQLLLDIQKNAMRTVLLTVEGIGILAAEQAINAALNVVKDTVNTALGFTLI